MQVSYTTTVKKMLIRHQNIKSIPEFNTEITRRGAELKSVWHFCGLHLHIMGLMVGYILHFGFLISAPFVSEKNDTRNIYMFKLIIHLKISNITVAFGGLQIV